MENWAGIFNSVSDVGAGWKIRAFKLDQLHPVTTAQLVVTDDSAETRIYRTTDLDADTPSWTQTRHPHTAA